MTPLLVLFVGTPPVTAVGTDLAYGAINQDRGSLQALAPEDD
jgi:uncharacterized membrane protein YfcA